MSESDLDHDDAGPVQDRAAALSRRSLLKVGAFGAIGVATASALAACSTSGSKSKASGNAAPISSVAAGGPSTQDYSHLKGKKVGLIGVAVTSEAPNRVRIEAERVAKDQGFTLDVVDTAGDYNKASSHPQLMGVAGIRRGHLGCRRPDIDTARSTSAKREGHSSWRCLRRLRSRPGVRRYLQ